MLNFQSINYKNVLYGFLSSLIIYIVLLNFFNSNDEILFTSLILLIFIYLPILLSFFFTKTYGIFFSFLLLIPIYFYNNELFYITLLFFLIPCFISFCVYSIKQQNIGYVLFGVSIYYILLISVFLITNHYKNVNSLIYNNIYDIFYFFAINIKSTNPEVFADVDLEQNLTILSIFLPSIIYVLCIMWFMFNYKITLAILNKSGTEKYLLNDYTLPVIFKWLLFIIAILAILFHKFLAKEMILYYSLYNIFIILWFCYFYLGLEYIWQKLEYTKNILFKILFMICFVVLFFELVLVICLLGFLIDTKIIKNNYFIKHKF